jgi:hypothetical protein
VGAHPRPASPSARDPSYPRPGSLLRCPTTPQREIRAPSPVIGEVVGYDHAPRENRLELHLGADEPDRVIAIALPLVRAALSPLPGSHYSVEGGGQSLSGLPISQ